MSHDEYGGFDAAEEIKQFYIVCLDTTAEKTVKLAGATDPPLGVNRTYSPAGETVDVAMICGYATRIILGGTVAVDDLLRADAAGKGVVASTGESTIARAIEAGVADEVIWAVIDKRTAP